MSPQPKNADTRVLKFKETATLLETAPIEVWDRIRGRALLVGPYERWWLEVDFRCFIDLNTEMFGPGNCEL